MNYYVAVMTDVIDYIEQCICDKLTLSELSSRAGISDFHFNRIFKTVIGTTLKQYILGRKLSYAAQLLSGSSRSVIDIAMDLGFEYPEVFSRAFKNQMGVSPAVYRSHPNAGVLTLKASVIERDIINYRGTLALKAETRFFQSLQLCGVHSMVNEYAGDFEQKLRKVNEAFLARSATHPHFMQHRFFTAVTCSGKDDGSYYVFCGREPKPGVCIREFETLDIPGGWYADFLYSGDMFDIREVLIDDLYRWIMVKGAKLVSSGIRMLDIYPGNYPDNQQIHILIPIEQPV